MKSTVAVVAAAAAAALLLGGAPAGAAVNGEPFAAAQWGLGQVGAAGAWDLTRGSGARVGIIDTGIDLSHSELAPRVVTSIRCIGTGGQASRCGGSAQDDSGHGTHVAGIIAASLDGAGVAGMAPEASLLVVKVLRADGTGEATDAAAGIDWLVGNGVNVVNLSLTENPSVRPVPGSPLETAIRRASAAGVVVVLAAGNNVPPLGGNAAFNLPAVIVGATDRTGRLAPYSLPFPSGIRYGLVAPGGDGSAGLEGEVLSTYWYPGRHSSYAWSAGTSMSAAHVSGAVALLAARGVRGQDAVDRLVATAAAVSCGTGCRGLLDAGAAVGGVPARLQAASTGATPVITAVAQLPAPPSTTVAAPVAVAPTTVPQVSAVASPAASAADAGLGDNPQAVIPQAVAPPDRAAALEVRDERARHDLWGWVAVGAAVALLTATAVMAHLSRRRLRDGAGW